MKVTVTIVVPIYNAYKDTEQCLESLLKYTDYRHKILLVDDASPDQRISELTEKVSLQFPNVMLLKNHENMGFVKTCNRAFRESEQKDDVVILNSDTIVTPNWLEKLILAAYSSSHIATVTPLTNNGTVCSVPNWLESNEIPEGQTILSFANLIEKISLRKYPTIPTAVGFCTYIKREILQKIGYFDDVNFIRGYGEENDFCCRASKSGYFHIIDDSTFVYHAGSKSFKADKQKLIEENSKILAKLHPRYFPEVHSFIEANPLKDILDNIKLHLTIEQIKKLEPICFILHNSIDKPINHPVGGTEVHCAALISNLSKTKPVYSLFYNKIKGSVEFEIFFKNQKLNFSFGCELQRPYSNNYFHHEAKLLRLLVGIFQYFQPSLIHIHHLIGIPIADIISAIKQVNIPYVISLHDYYLICPSYNLIDYKEKFCFEHKNPEYCQTCIQALFDEGEELRQQWLSLCQQILESATTIIAPSQTALSYFERDYPQLKLKEKSLVIRHGIFDQFDLKEKEKKLETSRKNNFTHPLKVALVGSISTAKGAKVFMTLLEKLSKYPQLNESFVFEIIGRFNLVIPNYIQNVKFRNEYSRQDLGVLLTDVDVAIFPNIWAETYCLTVDEVIAYGVPAITTPLNAASERVKKFEVGWVSNSASADDLLETLLYIKNNYEEYIKVKDNIKRYPLVSYEEMTEKYEEEYSKINHTIINTSSQLVITPKEISEAYFRSSFSNSLPISQDAQVELQRLRLMIKAMETSKWWKLRVAWLRLKKALGITIDDWWMKERGDNYK
ncbi:glycosyltransferase [Iningainema tapete]|uniref:Glycosyltransferase n=1 Tax=Iningainema tapete BLCC-T55 TaxID=2748662 RepID=A0A8J6XLS3_9CYAN|nr:glycosyltransferase [Iningainema tapete]MBD2774700.1 glycosyltransferase [Iningainema tapete BLCC-T55]